MLSHIKKYSLIYGILLICISILLTYFYRPYIYSHNIFDFYFADVIGNLFCVPASSLFLYGIKPTKYIKLILILTLSFIIYELLTVLPFDANLDIKDFIAIILGALFCVFIYKLIAKLTIK